MVRCVWTEWTNPLPPGLYIVATPIGNLGDLSPRAADTSAPRRPASSPRTRGSAPSCSPLRARRRRCGAITITAARRSATRSSRDSDTEAIALISDAGTPLISDPGYKLVRAARAAGRAVHTIPGPCAAIAALTLAGLPTDRFLFLGFLPAKAKARADAIAEVAARPRHAGALRKRPAAGDSLAALARRPGRSRGGCRARNQQIARGMRDRARLSELAERYAELSAEGRNRDRRRPARGSGRTPVTTTSMPRSTKRSDAPIPVAGRRRSRRAARRAAQAGLRPRARTRPRKLSRARRREARPQCGDASPLVAAAARLADPRPPRARARRRSRHRRAARPHAGLRRGQGARDREAARRLARRLSPAPGRGRGRAPGAALHARRRRPPHRRHLHRPATLAAPPARRLARVTKRRRSPRREAMSLRVAVQMDPLEGDWHCGRFDLRADAEGAGARPPAYSIISADDLTYEDGRVLRRSRTKSPCRRVDGQSFRARRFAILDLGRGRRCRADAPGPAVRPRLHHRDPLCSSGSPGETLVVNDPAAVRNAPEKLWVLDFARFMPPTVITRSLGVARDFLAAPWRDRDQAAARQCRQGGVQDRPRRRATSPPLLELFNDDLPRAASSCRPSFPQSPRATNGSCWSTARSRARSTAVPAQGEIRSNLAAGGQRRSVELTEREREICAALGPELKRRGLLFVGIDVIGGDG